MALLVIERGREADVILLRYAVFQSVVEALSGILFKAFTPNTPVAELQVRLFVAEREEEEILLLKVVQSDDESKPRDKDEAVGMFRVCTPPTEVMPKPPLFDVVAKV